MINACIREKNWKCLPQKKGKKLIRGRETVRSLGKYCNRRSSLAKQHKGKNLLAHLRPQKKCITERHINIHYNRAHIKSYTRFAFSNSIRNRQPYLVRRAIDDSAYVRCGTSEGFWSLLILMQLSS